MGKGKGRSSRFAKHGSKTKEPLAASELVGKSKVVFWQRNEVPLVEHEVILGQRREVQELDPMAQMVEMMKDLQ